MEKLRFAVFGTGFWSKFQIAAWQQLEGVELVAVYNRTVSKAEKIAEEFNIPTVYGDAEKLLNNESLDFVDIITDVDTHATFTELAARHKVDVICQKPMAPDLQIAHGMVKVCKENGVRFYIHENFRWQKPLRKFKEIITSGKIGKVFKSRVTFCSAFPVFENQPFLAELDQFIMTDIGSHIFDVCRFLFGEVDNLYCKIKTVNPKIKGEDVANVLMEMKDGSHCFAEMSYASRLEKESFPETLVLAEGDKGSVKLEHNGVIRTTTKEGTTETKIESPVYSWADPDYALIHASILDCNQDILQDLQRKGPAETTGEDNYRTIQLVFNAYESAKKGQALKINEPQF